jgi:NADPH:quinone reductase-like Zn-dependent oxidoreductase
MSERPRTMTAERLDRIRTFPGAGSNGQFAIQLLKELDAERAAHDASEQTIREQCAKIAKAHLCDDMDGCCCSERIAADIRSGK